MIKCLQKDSNNFPSKLSFIDKIYYIGNIELLDKKIVAVIGKRDVTQKELRIAYDVGRYIANQGYVVTNGIARGSDKAALEGALSVNGEIIAILPGGLRNIYPSSCKSLATKIINNNGLLISEYPPDNVPQKWQFIARDRIQAKIADKVCVIASDMNGGTMHTIKHADKILCYWSREGFNREGNKWLKDNNADIFSSQLELEKALA